MELIVKQLGPITKESKINLSDNLIVFTGGNSTGKSYLTQLIFSILNCYKLDHIGVFNSELRKFLHNKFTSENEIIMDVINFTSQNHQDLKYIFIHTIKILSDFIFGNDTIKIDFDIELTPVNADIKEIDYPVLIFRNGVIAEKNKSGDELITKSSLSVQLQKESFINEVANRISKHFFDKFFSVNNYYFPPERAAFNLLIKDIYGLRAEKTFSLNHRDSFKLQKYNFAIQQYFNFSYYLSDQKKNTSAPEIKDLADELEKILQVKIKFDTNDDIQITINKKHYNLTSSSSTIKSLSTIILYLRHIAHKGDILFIDEPELNLHPENQIKIARILAKAANIGLKIIISTHSDYIIKELSNLILLSHSFRDKENLIKQYNYRNNEILEPQKTGVYAVDENKVSEIDSINGIDISKIDSVISEMNQRSNDIYYSFLESIESANSK